MVKLREAQSSEEYVDEWKDWGRSVDKRIRIRGGISKALVAVTISLITGSLAYLAGYDKGLKSAIVAFNEQPIKVEERYLNSDKIPDRIILNNPRVYYDNKKLGIFISDNSRLYQEQFGYLNPETNKLEYLTSPQVKQRFDSKLDKWLSGEIGKMKIKKRIAKVAVGLALLAGTYLGNRGHLAPIDINKAKDSYGICIGGRVHIEKGVNYNGIIISAYTDNEGTINGINLSAILEKGGTLNGLEAALMGTPKTFSKRSDMSVVNGMQIGFANGAKIINGVQVGVINYSDDGNVLQAGLVDIGKESRNVQVGVACENKQGESFLFNYYFGRQE